jgi:hypothetical protein
MAWEGLTLEQLQAKRQELIAEIKKRGGKAAAPNYVARLNDLDKTITQVRSSQPTQENPTTPPPDNQNPGGGQQETAPPPPPPPDNRSELIKSLTEDVVDPRIKDIINQGGSFGETIADKYFSDGSLGRVGEDISPEMREILARSGQLVDQAGVRSSEMDNALANLKSLADQRGFTQLENEAIGRGRDALAGITPQQMEALRSIASEQINRDALTRLAQAQTAISRGGVRGAAAGAMREQIGQAQFDAKRGVTRDLLAKQVDEQRFAREAFNTLVGNFEGNRANREQAATKIYADTLGQTEGNEFNQKLGAQGLNSSTQQFADVFKRQGSQFNLDQAAKEKAGQVGSILGGVSSISGIQGSLKAEDLAEQLRKDSIEQMEKDRIFQQEIIDNQNKLFSQFYKGMRL